MAGALYANLFWLVFSLAACAAALELRLGEFNQPGPGLYPLTVGVAMALLSTASLLQTAFKRRRAASDEEASAERFRWWNLVVIVGAIAAYALTLDKVGFLLASFLFVGLLLKVIEPQPWRTALVGAALTAVSAEVVFNVVFRAQIPTGLLGF